MSSASFASCFLGQLSTRSARLDGASARCIADPRFAVDRRSSAAASTAQAAHKLKSVWVGSRVRTLQAVRQRPSWTPSATRSEVESPASDAEKSGEGAEDDGPIGVALEDAVYEEFWRWMDDGETSFADAVCAAEFESATGTPLRGLMAKRDIDGGEPFVRVPHRRMITFNTIAESELRNSSLSLEKMDETTLAALFLLLEGQKGRDSAWYPYLRILEADGPDHPIRWNRREREALTGSRALDWVDNCEWSWESLHGAICKLLLEDENNPIDPGMLTLSNFRWAMLIARTRGFSRAKKADETEEAANGKLQRIFALCPGLDLMNHDAVGAHFNTVWRFVEGEDGAPELWLLAAKPIRKGRQIWTSYGRLPNARLLSGYGFAVPGNAHDSVDLALPIRPADPLRPLKEAALSEIQQSGSVPGFSDDARLGRFDVPVGTRLPPALVAYARIASSHSEAGIKASLGSILEGLPPGEDEEARARAAVAGAAAERLVDYDALPAPAEEDGEPARDGRLRLAEVLVAGERAILRQLVDGAFTL